MCARTKARTHTRTHTQITWSDVRLTLLGLSDFAAKNDYMYTVANDVEITDEWISAVKTQLYNAYK